jgi:hypothetical protein
MTVVTMRQVELAIEKTVGRKKGMSEDEVKKLAEYLMSFFGYTDEVIDNRLTPADRDVFYTLEEEGLLTTTHEEAAAPVDIYDQISDEQWARHR